MWRNLIIKSFVSSIPIEKGETIDIVSDLLSIGVYCKRRKLKFNPNKLIDCFCDAVGQEGNVLIRTFSHDFCNKNLWFYKNTRKVNVLCPILRDNTLCFIWCLSGTIRYDNYYG